MRKRSQPGELLPVRPPVPDPRPARVATRAPDARPGGWAPAPFRWEGMRAGCAGTVFISPAERGALEAESTGPPSLAGAARPELQVAREVPPLPGSTPIVEPGA